MGSTFRYYLGLISIGAPAGLAIYHYCFGGKEKNKTTEAKCCCNADSTDSGCTDTCKEPCAGGKR